MPDDDVRLTQRASRLFWKLVKDLHQDDFEALLSCGLQPPLLYLYDYSLLTACRPKAGQVSWPIEFLCSKSSKKHVFPDVCAPPMSEIGRSIVKWANRTRWALSFHLGLVSGDTNS